MAQAMWDKWMRSYKNDPDKLMRLLIDEMATGKMTMASVLSELAWNDHNSEWYLQYEEIRKSWMIDEELVTPEMLAESVLQMLESS